MADDFLRNRAEQLRFAIRRVDNRESKVGEAEMGQRKAEFFWMKDGRVLRVSVTEITAPKQGRNFP